MRSPEAVKRAMAAYLRRNKGTPEYQEKRRILTRNWRKANPHVFAKTSYRYAVLKAKCKHRELELNLSFEAYKALIEGKPCHYCGLDTLSFGSGLDRVDSSRDYLEGNCVPCCYRCNVMKAELTVEEFYEQCERILDYRQKK